MQRVYLGFYANQFDAKPILGDLINGDTTLGLYKGSSVSGINYFAILSGSCRTAERRIEYDNLKRFRLVATDAIHESEIKNQNYFSAIFMLSLVHPLLMSSLIFDRQPYKGLIKENKIIGVYLTDKEKFEQNKNMPQVESLKTSKTRKLYSQALMLEFCEKPFVARKVSDRIAREIAELFFSRKFSTVGMINFLVGEKISRKEEQNQGEFK